MGLDHTLRKQQEAETKLAEQSKITENSVQQARAESQAEQAKANKQAEVVRIEQSAMVEQVKAQMEHKLRMERMGIDTRKHIANNNAQIQITQVERDAGLKMIDHQSTEGAANLRYKTLSGRKELHLSRKQEAEEAKANFQASMATSKRLGNELHNLHKHDASSLTPSATSSNNSPESDDHE